jgi:hypothetical protein
MHRTLSTLNFCRFIAVSGEGHPSRLAESNFMQVAHGRA